jgi:dTMP kinase
VTFIVLEGGEGSGKSTQAELLATRLRGEGRDVVLTYEPGDTKLGAQIRGMLLHVDDPIDAHTELLLMLADRAEHVATVIRPALERGAIVVCDRYWPSTLAYQGVGRGLGVDIVEQLNRAATQGLEPDAIVVLDVTDELATERRAHASDRFERESGEFHHRVREAYRIWARERGWILLDGSGSIDDVAAGVRASLGSLLDGD